jgi:hypothetical protein
MNARLAEAPASSRSNPASVAAAASPGASAVLQAPMRHVHRQRDFGVGYGNSSGYGRERHYTSNGFAPLFRCA